MPPNSSGSPPLLLKTSMRRIGPPGASTTPSAVKRSEFEDFMNAYRPTLDLPLREPPPRVAEESKVDFGRSIKKLMKRPQGSPNTQSKNHRKEGVQRTATVIYPDVPSSKDSKLQAERQKSKRPLSAHMDVASLAPPPPPGFAQGLASMPPPPGFVQGLASMPPLEVKVNANVPPPVPPPAKSPKSSVQQTKGSKPPAALQVPPNPPAKSSKASAPASPQSKVPPKLPKPPEDVPRVPEIGAGAPVPSPNQMKKKVSILEETRRSATDSHCLIITGNNIGRFLPPRHNPDPILNMRMVSVPERKYHVIFEFEESPQPPRPLASSSGLMVIGPEDDRVRDTRDQLGLFSWIRESHVAHMGLLLVNVERITEFPFVTYLVVSGGRHELAQKLKYVGERPVLGRQDQLRFLAGYEEPVTICRPPLSTFPDKPSEKTGFVICLYQVLEGDDGARFEQNWVMWTGARQIYRTLPAHMGLRRMSVHKSIIPTKTINYVLVCEFDNIMDHLTDACVIIDHLRARCCGFIGIFRVLDAL